MRLLQGPNPRIYRNEFFNGEILGASKIRFYRFEGVLIKDGMMVSDVPERWPLIDQLQELLDKLKYLQSRGQKGKPVQRRIEQLAVQI
ncbi:MAG: hypothetical protein HY231_23705 [Acidobacteria bacterium]|nr:hypothetical protein [Acidobacteriota bacterium]